MDNLKSKSREIPINKGDCVGLIDKQPAIFDFGNQDNWQACIELNQQVNYNFLPLDHNKSLGAFLYESGNPGLTKSLCDVVLFTDRTICLVEMTEGRKDWKQDKIEQLRSTVDQLKNTDLSISNFEIKKAYISNKRHPNIPSQDTNAKSCFYKIGVRFSIKFKISRLD